jgi:hypothetical protein
MRNCLDSEQSDSCKPETAAGSRTGFFLCTKLSSLHRGKILNMCNYQLFLERLATCTSLNTYGLFPMFPYLMPKELPLKWNLTCSGVEFRMPGLWYSLVLVVVWLIWRINLLWYSKHSVSDNLPRWENIHMWAQGRLVARPSTWTWTSIEQCVTST